MRTDPAAEILEMCKILQSTPSSTNKTHIALARVFNCGNSQEPLFWTMLAVSSKRFDALIQIIKTSEAVPDDLRQESEGAVHHLRQIFSADHLNNRWDERKAAVFVPERLTAVKYLSGLIRDKHPLKKITGEERSALIQEIDTTLKEIEITGDESFVRDAIVTTLEAIKQILERLEFFGVDALTEKLLWACSNLSAAEAYATREEKSWTKKAKRIVAKVLAAMIYTDIVLTAAGHHVDRIQTITQFLVEQMPHEMPALEDLRNGDGDPGDAKNGHGPQEPADLESEDIGTVQT